MCKTHGLIEDGWKICGICNNYVFPWMALCDECLTPFPATRWMRLRTRLRGTSLWIRWKLGRLD